MTVLQGLAEEIWKKKYRYTDEQQIEEMWRRVAAAAASLEENPAQQEDIFRQLQEDFKFLPGGRISAGAGTRNNYLLNCAVLPIEGDSIEHIYEAIKKAAVLAKCNYGVGFNFSSLRPKNAAVSKGGVASGPVSFMKVFDASGSIIETGGGRRAAAIGVLRVDHPDIFEFIDAKREQGVLTQFNISVAVTKKFLAAVEAGEDFDLVYDGKVYRTVPALDIWNKLVESGYHNNDPGILCLDEINHYNNGWYMYDIEATNPCFTGDMQLLTSEGYQRFDALEGKAVEVVNLNGNVCLGKVWKSGDKETVKLTFPNKSKAPITCTPDHRFMLTTGEECEAKDTAGKRLMPFFTIKNSFVNKDSFMAGFIQGDGTATMMNNQSQCIDINLGAKDRDICALFGVTLNDGVRKWNSSKAKEVALNFGILPVALPERSLPTGIRNAEGYNDFLSGLWSANGSVIKGSRVALKTTCRKLADELVFELRESFDITAYVTTNKAKKVKFSNGEYTCKESYDVNINRYDSVLAFAKHISFGQKYKQDALKELIKFKAPLVVRIKETGILPVYDFSEPETHWGVVEGVVAHNCGEIPLPEHGVCCLGNINLTKFIIEPFSTKPWQENFDWLSFEETIHTAVRFLDNILDVSDYPYPVMKGRATGDRRIGLCTVAGLGSALAMWRLPYDSPEAVQCAEALQKYSTEAAYLASIELAKEKGAFPNFSKELYLQSHFVKLLPKSIQEGIALHGIRNIALMTIPPVGTGSLLAGNISNGLEPIFSLEYDRKVRQTDGSSKTEPVEDYAWGLWKKGGHKDTPEFFKTSREIAPIDHVSMQVALQRWIDGSISKTANIPAEFSLEDYDKLMRFAIASGVKGFTTFREGTREGVLSTKKEEKRPRDKEEAIKGREPKKKRPRILSGHTYKISDDQGNLYVTINNIEEKGKIRPFEIFIESNSETASLYTEWYKAISKLMSAVMRRTDDTSFMINDLKSIYAPKGYFSDGQYMQSKPQMIGNILEEHLRLLSGEGKKESYSKCPECGELAFSKEGGCGGCKSCGFSKCG